MAVALAAMMVPWATTSPIVVCIVTKASPSVFAARVADALWRVFAAVASLFPPRIQASDAMMIELSSPVNIASSVLISVPASIAATGGV